MRFRLFFIVLSVSSIAALEIDAQSPGCTDPLASNYDPLATENDGSCIYPATSYDPEFITFLSDTVHESSGLAFYGGLLWTQNDSGNPHQIHAVDTVTGAILRSVWISNAANSDWESLAQSETHLFIGDFGNNQGNRTDIQIFRIAWDSLMASDTVTADVIAFSYPDQTDFSVASNNNEYDCEAFYYLNDSLHLFTKNWVSQTTRYYTLPAQPGQFGAILKDSLDTDGLITGSAVHPDGSVVLCGYKNIGSGFWTCFAWLLYDYPDSSPFGGNKRKIDLGNALQLGQMEAVWIKEDFTGWITGEAISVGPFSFDARLSGFDFGAYFKPSGSNVEGNIEPQQIGILIYPNPARGVAQIEISPSDLIHAELKMEVYDTLGRVVYDTLFPQGTTTLTIPTDDLPRGIYTISLLQDFRLLATGQLVVE